jgi:chaperonin GroEL (HSP60 family)
MLLDPMGGIVLTNDGNAILREVRYALILFIILLKLRFANNFEFID